MYCLHNLGQFSGGGGVFPSGRPGGPSQPLHAPGQCPEPISRPGALFFAGALHTRGWSELHLRNYRSRYTQTKAPLGSSPVGVGLILPPHRKAPYSPFTPLWRRFLHPTSGTNIRTVRKIGPRRCLCTGAGTHRLQKRNALPLGRTLSQTGFIDLLSADA